MAKIIPPDYACLPTFKVFNEGDENCDHEWRKSESDDYITWRCTKCPKRCGCEVYG
jgi:hypothetical protein